jgi:hypothetical protein
VFSGLLAGVLPAMANECAEPSPETSADGLSLPDRLGATPASKD